MVKRLVPADFPNIVCLCGSSRFKDLFFEVGAKLEKAGNLVLMMAFFQHADNVEVTEQDRKVLDKLDYYRIDLADEVYIIDDRRIYCPTCNTWIISECYPACECENLKVWERRQVYQYRPYIGESTQRELDYAAQQGKKITFYSKAVQGR